jgi:cytochrome P450
MSDAGDFCTLLYQLAQERSGEDVPLVMAGVPLLIVQNIDAAQRILRTNAGNYVKHMPWFRQALGASRMTENGEAWQFRQRLSQAYLAKFDRQGTFERCARHGAATVEKLGARSAAGEPRLADDLFREMAAAVMLETFFGRTLEESGVDVADIVRMIAFGSEYAFMPEQGRAALAPDRLRGFLDVRAKVLAGLASFRAGEVEADSLLSRIRELSAAPDNGFVLEHELTLFFAAGAETTAASMGWACYLLARNPELQEKLRLAADRFWSGSAVDWEQLSDVSEFEAFLDAVLRIFPPTPVIGRKALGSDALGGHHIGPGDQVLVSMVGVQHGAKPRANPWSIDLDAVGAKAMNAGHSFAFSVGPRVCAGARFAVVEMMSFLALFLREARFELTSTGPPQFRWQSQLLHEGGQPVKVVRR